MQNGLGSSQYRGDLDELRLWNIVRSQNEIQANMFTRLQGNETGLAGYWNFDEGSGQVVNDQTQYQINGQLGNSAITDAGDPLWILASESLNGTTPTPVPTPPDLLLHLATRPYHQYANLATPTATPTLPSFQEMVIPGWIGSPAQQATVSGVVPITLVDGITLQSGSLMIGPSTIQAR